MPSVMLLSSCLTLTLLSLPGKTRTKDKYRVVYTDHQRLELEKEFHYSRYITIRRKAELAAALGLTERQVKIWFQNRRAKERKVNKKKLQQQSQPTSTTTPTPPAVGTPGPMGTLCSGSAPSLVSSSPLTIKEEFMP